LAAALAPPPVPRSRLLARDGSGAAVSPVPPSLVVAVDAGEGLRGDIAVAALDDADALAAAFLSQRGRGGPADAQVASALADELRRALCDVAGQELEALRSDAGEALERLATAQRALRALLASAPARGVAAPAPDARLAGAGEAAGAGADVARLQREAAELRVQLVAERQRATAASASSPPQSPPPEWHAERRDLLTRANEDRASLVAENGRLRAALAASAGATDLEARLRSHDTERAALAAEVTTLHAAVARGEAELRRTYGGWEADGRAWAEERQGLSRQLDALAAAAAEANSRARAAEAAAAAVGASPPLAPRASAVRGLVGDGASTAAAWATERELIVRNWAEECEILVALWREEKAAWDAERAGLKCQLVALRSSLPAPAAAAPAAAATTGLGWASEWSTLAGTSARIRSPTSLGLPTPTQTSSASGSAATARAFAALAAAGAARGGWAVQ
jgi:hypothetical protein